MQCAHDTTAAPTFPLLQLTPPPARHLTARQQSAEDNSRLRCVFDSFAAWGKSGAQAAAGAEHGRARQSGCEVAAEDGACAPAGCLPFCLPWPSWCCSALCAGGEPSLDGTQLQKLCRDAELLNRQLTSTRLDLLFSAAVGKVSGWFTASPSHRVAMAKEPAEMPPCNSTAPPPLCAGLPPPGIRRVCGPAAAPG